MDTVTIKRAKDEFDPKKMLFGTRIFPAHCTRDDESIFYGLTVGEADKLKDLIPEGRITGQHEIFTSRQFKFPSELPSGLMFWADGTIELWVEYARQKISIVIPVKYET